MAISKRAAPMLVPDLIRPIPVPTSDKGKMTGTDDTRPTGPSDKLILNKSIPKRGGVAVNSNKSIDESIAKPLPITTQENKKGLVNNLINVLLLFKTYSSKYAFQTYQRIHQGKALIQQVIFVPHWQLQQHEHHCMKT